MNEIPKKVGDTAVRTMTRLGLDEDLATLLNPVLPEPEHTPDGTPYFTPDEVRHFDTLFQRFGLQFSSADPQFEDIQYLSQLWYRLVGVLGAHIACSAHSPKLFALELRAMPADFQAYLRAVIQDDREEAHRLAAKLDIANLEAFCVK